MDEKEKELNQKSLKNGEVPKELQQELERLQRREKIYTWLVAGALSVVVFLGITWYQAQAAAKYSSYGTAGFVNNSLTSGGGGCCSSGGGSANVDLSTVEAQGLAYYQQTNNDSDVTAKATDYGCHLQCDIYKGDTIVKSYSYQNGQFYEI